MRQALVPRYVSLEGPVEKVGDDLVLLIPLSAGGDELSEVARKISTVEDGVLKVVIPVWLAEKLHIQAGSLVLVDNRNGKFNITPTSKPH